MECLASWKEGSSRYLVGLIQYQHHASYEDRFRCFAYERPNSSGRYSPSWMSDENSFPTRMNFSTYHEHNDDGDNNSETNKIMRVAQSGDATCNGLAAMEGSRTMTMQKGM